MPPPVWTRVKPSDSPGSGMTSLSGRRKGHFVQPSKDRRWSFATQSEPAQRPCQRGAGRGFPDRRMALEGHWQRVNTPLRQLGRRERNVAIVAVIVALVAVLAL